MQVIENQYRIVENQVLIEDVYSCLICFEIREKSRIFADDLKESGTY